MAMNTNTVNVPSGSDTVLYQAEGRGCTSFTVDVPSGTFGVFVHVDGLHALNEYVPIPSPGGKVFRYNDCGITKVVATRQWRAGGGRYLRRSE